MQKSGLFGVSFMRKRFFSAILAISLCVYIAFCGCIGVFALDDKYTIDELGLSIKIPKEYIVITRTLERDDEAFSKLVLDYDETMTAFSAAHVYLQAVTQDGVLKITLTGTSDENSKAINNYSDLTSAERQKVLESFMVSGSYTSGVEIKHNGNIFFDLALTQAAQDSSIYCYQCHTVVNGMNINLTLHKYSEELTRDEIKIVTDMANTINFDKIKRTTGPSFEWWRILLWIVILVAIGVLAKYFYGLYHSTKHSKNERRPRKVISDDDDFDEDVLLDVSSEYKSESGNMHALLSDLGLGGSYDDEEITFDELLGYDTTDYKERANTELESFDIKVKAKNRKSGVSYFEDSGESIDKKPKQHYESKSHAKPRVSNSQRTDKSEDYFADLFSDKSNNEVIGSSVSRGSKSVSKGLKNSIKGLFSNASGKNGSRYDNPRKRK